MDVAQVEKLFEHKPQELQHLFLDTENLLRDRHIEDMFTTLFNGGELDDIFRINFRMYYKFLTAEGEPTEIPEAVFDNVIEARAWVSTIGLLHVTEADHAYIDHDPTYSNCRYMAKLRTYLAPEAKLLVYAPYELHVILLTVVYVFRCVAERYHQIEIPKYFDKH